MASYNDRQNANNPLWDKRTSGQALALTGAAQPISGLVAFGNPSYIIISNIGANNVWVSPDPAVVGGILVQPGATFETAVGEEPSIHILGTVAQMVFILQYQ